MGSSSLPIGYYFLQIFSFVANTVLTLTLVFGFKQPGVSRPSPLLPANTSTYSLFGIVACLLLFTNHVHGPEPPQVLCQAQSALMLAFPPALSGLALSLVLAVWRLAWLVHHERTPWFTDTQFNTMLIVFPYLFFVGFAVAGSIVGTQSSVTRHGFYCMTDNKTLTTLNAAATLVILAITTFFQAWTLFIVCKRYRISRKFGRAEVGSDVPLFIRVLSFGLFVFFAMVLSSIALVNYASPVPDILVALFGPVVFFIFASQDEVLRCWKLKSPRTIISDRSDSVATLNSARPPRIRPRDSNTFSFISAPNPVSELHSYRFPPPSPSTPTA